MAKKTILAIEDEEDILATLHYNFSKQGYEVHSATTGEDGLRQAKTLIPDLILLDLMLPGMDGLEVCRILKHDPRTGKIPVVMLTARGEEADIVAGLELGADDYITKPFSPRVVVARVQAVLRRGRDEVADESCPVQIHDLMIHPGRREVRVHNRPVDLTFTEFQILHFLTRHPGWVFTRNQITDAVRGEDYPVTERAVDVHIVALRKKLGPCGKYIETVRGVGYRFKE